MRSKFLGVFVLSAILAVSAFSQSQSGVTDTRPMVLEIDYSKGMQFVYQRIGGATLFGAFRFLPEWKAAPDAPMIQGINMRSSIEDGVVRIRVSLLEGKNFEIDVPVGEYTVTQGKPTIVSDLTKFGLIPIEVALVRAPETVSQLPSIVNKTKSLSVSVEPVSSNIPSFKVRVFNLSTKGVMAYSSETSLNGQKLLTGTSSNRNGTVFIEPGQSAEKILPYPTKPVTTSTGRMPEAQQAELVLTIHTVMFEDGTYEGEAVYAVRYRSGQVGQKIEIQRIVNQLRAKYDTVDAFAADLSDYRFSMDEVVFGAFLKEFPNLSEQDIKDMREIAESEAVNTQRDIFKVFSAQRADFSVNPGTFQVWKDAEIKQCQRLLNSFPQ